MTRALREQRWVDLRSAEREEALRSLAHRAFSRQHGFGRFVDLGPSMLLDVIAYAVERGGDAVQGVAEGFEMLVFPQLEGLGDA
jgi:hypothetical protein